ncbi:MAG: T9SS type A sorting domain-containing protein, partial [Cyclobacteriaceae bacterium]
NADSMEIWRKEGLYEGNVCDLVDPEGQTFVLAGKVVATQQSFTDVDLPQGTVSSDFTWHLKATFSNSTNDLNDLISVLTSVKPEGVPKVSVFPNPTKSAVFIQGDRDIKYFRIINISGKLIMQGDLKSSTIDNLDTLEDGIYFISLLDSKQKQIHGTRLLIQK